jgi:O-6-methylguanine DNA methyltransferase
MTRSATPRRPRSDRGMLVGVSRIVAFDRVDTPLGTMHVAATPRGVAAMSRETSTDHFIERLARRFPRREPVPDAAAARDATEWLLGYLAGARSDAPALDLEGITAFDARVYDAVVAIPYGATATYGDVARVIGSPRAARAVGGALSRCPLFPAVPCHRVVLASDGVSGWGGGDIALKRRLIALEGGA